MSSEMDAHRTYQSLCLKYNLKIANELFQRNYKLGNVGDKTNQLANFQLINIFGVSGFSFVTLKTNLQNLGN